MGKKKKLSSIAALIGILCLSVALTISISACSSNEATEATPIPTIEATATPTATPTPKATQKPLFLIVTSPEDESVVETSEVMVTGETLPTAIVSINGEEVNVEDDGTFSTTVTLEEGPNDIQIVASTLGGQETSVILMVAYMP